jgi:glutathione S-transferase
MKLYNLTGCPYCRLVVNRLSELGLAYETVEVPAAHADRHAVRAVSGQSYVPVLVDGDVVLDDENDILAYLDKTYGKSDWRA